MDVNQNELIFDAAKDSIKRFRWLLTTTTLLSSLILMHLYLEQLGTVKSQFEQTVIDDVRLSATLQNNKLQEDKSSQPTLASGTDSTQSSKGGSKGQLEPELYQGRLAKLVADEKVLINKLAGKDFDHLSDDLKKDLERFAEEKVVYLRTYNGFKDFKPEDRELPLLNLQMHANDYVPVMAVMLSIMTAGVWLSASSLEVALRRLARNTEGRAYVEVLKLRLTFLFPGDCGEINCFNNLLLDAAMWVPAVALLISACLEIHSVVVRPNTGVLPGNSLMLLRWLCLGGCFFWSFIFALRGMLVIHKIKEISYPASTPDASNSSLC
jgi:hypothetical protein